MIVFLNLKYYRDIDLDEVGKITITKKHLVSNKLFKFAGYGGFGWRVENKTERKSINVQILKNGRLMDEKIVRNEETFKPNGGNAEDYYLKLTIID
jgi:hypothetical protein